LEKHETKGEMDLLYMKVSQLTYRKKKPSLRIYRRLNKPQAEDMHLETDTEEDAKLILFSEFETALSEL